MVNVYVKNVEALPDPLDNPEIMESLSAERKEKVLRCRKLEDRRRSLGAGLLLKLVLDEYGIDSRNIFLEDGGKPIVSGLCFNLSHSGSYAVCAVSNKPVGCDIERISAVREGIAERYFTVNEVEYLNSLGEEKNRSFFRLWTMKESYLKMTGEGMRVNLDQVEFVIGTRVKAFRNGVECACSIKEYEMDGYCLTVCAEDEEFAEMVRIV